MKKNLFLVIFTLSSFFFVSNAQWITNTVTLYNQRKIVRTDEGFYI